MIEIKCQQCGKIFKARLNKRKYCSIQCAGKDIAENKKCKIITKCIVCGTEIYHVKSKHPKYCSKECKYIALRNGIYKTCIMCGKKFYVWKKYNEKYDAICCSWKCRALRMSQKIKKICPQCNKEFLVKPSQSSQEYCSMECRKRSRDLERTKICKNCNKQFFVKYPSYVRKFCSVQCSGQYRKRWITSICNTCKKEFEHSPYAVGRYCSKECYLKNSGISAVELLLKDKLETLGFKHQFKYTLGWMDYGNENKKIAVFVDGKFWHGHSDYEWKHLKMAKSIERAIVRDKEQTEFLENNGWTVLRYWDDYVRSNTDECLNEIATYIAGNR